MTFSDRCLRITPTTAYDRSNGIEAPEHHTPRAAHQLPPERDHGVRAGGGGRPVPVSVRGTGATRRGRGREGVISAGTRADNGGRPCFSRDSAAPALLVKNRVTDPEKLTFLA